MPVLRPVRHSRFFPEDRQALAALSEEQVLLSSRGQGECVLIEFRQPTTADATGPPGCCPTEDRPECLGKQPASLLGWRLAGEAFSAPAHIFGGLESQLATGPNDGIGWGITLAHQRPESVEGHGNFLESGISD